MKVSVVNSNNVNFKARNKYIRTAYDILRLVKSEFPMVSSTYIDTFYLEGTPEKNTLSKLVSKRIARQIENTRDIYLSKSGRYMVDLKSQDIEHANAVLLNEVSKSKSGNCYESAVVTLAALSANGFNDSKKVQLYLTTECIDKKNKEKVFRNMTDLDHVFVVTSMGKKSDKQKDIVVVDSWLGFADSVSGANAKFKQSLSKEYTNAKNKHERLFMAEMSEKGKNTTLDDYLIRHHFSYVCLDSLTQSEIDNLGDYAKSHYSNIVKSSMKPQNTPANI